MSKQISPFAALTGAEKQIKWLEYQSIRLPYVQTTEEPIEAELTREEAVKTVVAPPSHQPAEKPDRPQPPPEVPRSMPDFQKTRHSQYDAVIARLKQAELQSRRYQSSQPAQKS